jgi:radical SAM superfamily enzyme YgiQ (UPF0313 family)
VAAPGYPIVLTADRTLTARYHLLFDGMVAASATSSTPGFLARFLTPRARSVDGRAARAPLGLRRIEAALLRSGFPVNDVAVVEEAYLSSAIGPKTRVIGVSSGEPLGRGMNSSTMTAISGGHILPHVYFSRLMHRVGELARDRAPSARVVLGGPGVWQFSEETRKSLGIHHIVTGYAEDNAPELFQKLINGEELPEIIEGECPESEDIPSIRGASTMGAVELSRGCGLGCLFCTIANEKIGHVPLDTIMRDVRINVKNRQLNLSLLSEDFFRYGGKSGQCNPAALVELAQSLRSVPTVRLLQIDHVNLSSVAQFTDSELATVQRLLTGGPRHQFLWVNVGVETASGVLLKQNGGGAKLGGCEPCDWAEFSAVQVERLILAGYFPFVSLMVGLPGETEEDVLQTIEWVNQFGRTKLAVFPLIYAPVNGDRPPDPRKLTAQHWRLIRDCYRLNFRWIPRLYRDNQRGGGVPLHRRLLIRLLSRAQIMQWRFLMMWNHWRVED